MNSSIDWLASQTPVIKQWQKDREAMHDTDRISFMDGHRVYLQFKDAYIAFDGCGWEMRVDGKDAEAFETFRAAFDAYTEAVSHLFSV